MTHDAAWGVLVGGAISTHLLADMSTYSGVPIIWPLTDRSLHILPKPLRFRTDSAIEYGIVFGGRRAGCARLRGAHCEDR